MLGARLTGIDLDEVTLEGIASAVIRGRVVPLLAGAGVRPARVQASVSLDRLLDPDEALR
ncbi:MAG TPA: hypothetical protein VHF22_03575 [Planctomycetota bacterium]|nr:hypothetical protein [Planctomycetota bacterium]